MYVNNISIDNRQQYENNNIRTRQPNRKYQEFYHFFLKQKIDGITNIEVREYNEQETKILLMFLQNLNPNNKETKLTGICNATTYSLKKGILKYGNNLGKL